MALFSKQNKEAFTNPLNLDHPILGQVLGICSALAVTSQLKPAIVMGLAVTVITAFANVIISIIRNTIPNRIRIVVQLVDAMILVIVGAVRELLGRGSLLGFQIIPDACYDFGYVNNGMMTMPAMALILVGCVIWVHRAYFYKEK